MVGRSAVDKLIVTRPQHTGDLVHSLGVVHVTGTILQKKKKKKKKKIQNSNLRFYKEKIYKIQICDSTKKKYIKFKFAILQKKI